MHEHTERLVRDTRERPFRPGDRIELPEVHLEVLETTKDHRPARVRFQWDRSLDSPRLRWLAFRDTRYEPFKPPAIGQCVVLPANDLLAMLLGTESALTRFFSESRAKQRRDRPELCPH